MYKIYCIEDINDLKYIGITTQSLKQRLSQHKTNKYRTKYQKCSSNKLNLEYCIIYELENCDDKKREQYWIDNTDCVNINNSVNDINKRKEYYKQTHIKDKRNQDRRTRRNYQASWGGDERNNNNLLLIDINLFN